ncbi:outer membrane beta-barrel protein [Pontibacter sp. G13]|uniref:outer membrane beta-barrel protein n=1 Tax=Pontibacter sp. G13 TaxID=3074898 RepID=UPI00288AC1DD|nr:outer membrane beta-barrel protein [Pontibacter sp. G13]WNJ20603.1 outer membrane beta-barrel protein [Pontibacter sp. G13]
MLKTLTLQPLKHLKHLWMVLACAGFLMMSNPSQAQFGLILQVGGNSSQWINNPDDVETAARVGYLFGGSFFLGDSWFLMPGVFWGNQSTRVDLGNGEEDNVNRRVLQIPIVGGYRFFHNTPIFSLRPYTGPVLDFQTSVGDNDLGFDKGDFKDLVWQWRVGVGADIFNFTVDLAYDFGISDLLDDGNVSNQTFNLLIGFRLISPN